ncbi:glycosyltransferase family 2 protein [Deinococcus sp.]|uniref:glycosyltransferase family 2 protein n=1 Tax=Deinococcus sp. TaxID=47478 RepID=UPI0025CE2DF6|nr:glycosyltransferase family 2 protein [Deinococcus sp.]
MNGLAGAVIVSYNPNHNVINLSLSISNIIPKERIIIVDNGSASDEYCLILERNGFVVNRLLDNYGIARAINEGAAHLLSMGVDCFLTFDQDSDITPEFIASLSESYVNLVETSPQPVAMLCPNFFDVNAKTFAKFTLINNWSVKNFSVTEEGGLHKTTFAITSGSLVSMSAFISSGGLDEDLFIDHVDSEFCVRLISMGYDIWVDGDIVFNHSVGERTKEKFLGLTIKPNNHNPIRRYYIFRNGIAVQNKYFREFPGFLILNIMRNIHEIISIVVFEKDKVRKLEGAFLGTRDGFLGKMGRRDTVRRHLRRGRS